MIDHRAHGPYRQLHIARRDRFEVVGGSGVARIAFIAAAILAAVSTTVSSTRAQDDVPPPVLEFERQPQLQQLTETSVHVLWRTTVPTEGWVTIEGREDDHRSEAVSKDHEVVLTDLEPGEEIAYTVTGVVPPELALELSLIHI